VALQSATFFCLQQVILGKANKERRTKKMGRQSRAIRQQKRFGFEKGLSKPRTKGRLQLLSLSFLTLLVVSGLAAYLLRKPSLFIQYQESNN